MKLSEEMHFVSECKSKFSLNPLLRIYLKEWVKKVEELEQDHFELHSEVCKFSVQMKKGKQKKARSTLERIEGIATKQLLKKKKHD